MTLGKHALQALSSLSARGTASGGSCCGVCGCWVIDARRVGASEVVCRHDGSVNMAVVVVKNAMIVEAV
jgi:hypothetical protein